MTPSIGWAVRLGQRLGRWVAVAAAGLLAIAMIRRDAARDARRDADLKAADRREETNHDAAEKRQAVDRLGDAAVRERLRDWSRDDRGDR